MPAGEDRREQNNGKNEVTGAKHPSLRDLGVLFPLVDDLTANNCGHYFSGELPAIEGSVV